MFQDNFFYEVAWAEKGGFGIWYEYLAKSRIFKRYSNKKNILIFGLPEKYSLGLDTLLFAKNCRLDVLSNNKKDLENYGKFAKQFKRKVKLIYSKSLNSFKPFKKYDLAISTEVIQNDVFLISSLKKIAKTILIFVPNGQGYAHPKISKLNSLSLKELKKLGIKNKLKILEGGYIDCPPWPAGACLPKSNEEKTVKENKLITLIKRILTKSIPLLAKFDNFYFSPWKQINSHMVYCIFENEKDF